MRSKKPLPKMRLCGHLLPWVDKIIHLGNTITNQVDMISSDMNMKKGRYIARNIEINQEFNFADLETKIKVNSIYNSKWFGSVLRDIFSPAAVMVESSYNQSMKVTMSLPHATHRELIEPLSGTRHVKLIFIQRFFKMIASIHMSNKPILKILLGQNETDTRSTTGQNLRNIMLLVEKTSIYDITHDDLEAPSTQIESGESSLWNCC